MSWMDQLSKAETKTLDLLDAQIAVLKTKRYKLQNAATQRAMREAAGDKKRKTKAGKAGAKARKAKGRAKKPTKRRSQRKRPSQIPAATGSAGIENTDVGSGT